MKKKLILILSLILSTTLVNVKAATCSSDEINQLRSQIPNELYTMDFEKQTRLDIDGDGKATTTKTYLMVHPTLDDEWIYTFVQNDYYFNISKSHYDTISYGVNTLNITNERCGDDIIYSTEVFIPHYEIGKGFVDMTSKEVINNKKKDSSSIWILIALLIGFVLLDVYLIMCLLKQRRDGYE